MLFPGLTWKVETHEPNIYLTFDDGPNPGTTDEVLNILDAHDAKATFFCVGGNIDKYPKLFGEILRQGHRIGNHTYNHINGRKAATSEYLENVEKCSALHNTSLFRPPYGRLKYSQLKALKRQSEIVMWDVLGGDFDQRVSKEKCLENIVRHTSKGSIVLLHDSHKFSEKVLYALPKFLDHFTQKGYEFKALP